MNDVALGNREENYVSLWVRSAVFHPERFGAGNCIWRGPLDGDGLHGREWQDERCLRLQTVNFWRLKFVDAGFSLQRGIANRSSESAALLTAGFAIAAVDEAGQPTLRCLQKLRHINRFAVPGTIILRRPGGKPCIVCLYAHIDDLSWHPALQTVEEAKGWSIAVW